MNSDHLRCYRTLGVEPGCSWTALRSAYRRLVRRWHPDSRPTDMPSRAAEERIKEITIAYRTLSEYRKQHGRLPAIDPTYTAGPAPAAAGSEVKTNSTANRQRPEPQATVTTPKEHGEHSRWGKPVLRMLIAGMLLAIGYTAARNMLSGDEPLQEPATAPSVPRDSPAGEVTRQPDVPSQPPKFFGVGSPVGTVYEVQGIPSRVDGDVWYYGESKVYFQRGVVGGWDEHSLHPLKVHDATNDERARQVQRDFGIGSTKEEVRSLQGAPVIESESVWDYGLSKVYFENGRVAGWSNSPMRPLKLRKQKPDK